MKPTEVFRADGGGVAQSDYSEIRISRDDGNCFEDSRSAITFTIFGQSLVQDGELVEGPGYCRFTGVAQQEIDVTVKMEKARQIHAALGRLIEGEPR